MNEKILIFGSSGHARSIAVIVEALNYQIVGFIDSYLPVGTKVLNYETLGDESILKNCKEKFGTIKVVVGIGDLMNRQKVVEKIKAINPDLVFPTIISPTAYVSSYISLGQGTVVFNNSFINVEGVIGDFCVINSSSIVEHNTVIGDYCNVSPGANIGGNVTIDSNSFIGSSATIIQKINVGSHSVVGAGAVVISNIPDRVLAVGIPATIKKENYSNENVFR